MSVSALIITAERNIYVDFSKPFMDMGLDILMAKETPDADIFYFFRPFRFSSQRNKIHNDKKEHHCASCTNTIMSLNSYPPFSLATGR